MTHERLSRFAGSTGRRAACIVILFLLLAIPPLELVPFATTGPMIVISIFGLGLLYSDGLLMLLGFVGAAFAVVGGLWGGAVRAALKLIASKGLRSTFASPRSLIDLERSKEMTAFRNLVPQAASPASTLSFYCGYPRRRWHEPERRFDLLIQDFADLQSQLLKRGRLWQEMHTRVQHSIVHDRIARISCREQNAEFGLPLPGYIGEQAPAHARHDDVGEEQANLRMPVERL